MKTCKHCQRPFLPVRHWQSYCSDACRFTHYNRNDRKVSKDGQGDLHASTRIPDVPPAVAIFVILLIHHLLLWS